MKKFTQAILVTILLSGMVNAAQMLPVDNERFLNQPSLLGYVADEFIVVLKDQVPVNHAADALQPVALEQLAGFRNLSGLFKVDRLRPQFAGADQGLLADSDSKRSLARHYKIHIQTGTLEEAMEAY
ncbi:MAG: hypothetical protein ISR91_07615, partial [Candidatus Delongbacteria bacterium]|nr:hypothetical protein [Candidatus Delongbacteria bacterium]